MLRVVVAEDSPTVRRHLQSMIASDARFELAGMAADGEEAVELALRLGPDVMTMDLQMPRLDGVAATQRIMAARPCPIVVIAGDDNDDGFRALAAGALEIVHKPRGLDAAGYETLRRSLLDTLALMAGVKVVRRWTPRTSAAPGGARRVSAIGICASTGGPPALESILRELRGVRVPVLVVQHIAAGFGANLALWLATTSALPVSLARDGAPLESGHVYIAPEDRHLTVRDGAIALVDAAPVRHHRPSGDLLFASLAETFGAGAAGVVLTGMGRDGAEGLRALHLRGGHVIAQESSTCVIASMPRAAIDDGCADEVLPLCGIARRLKELT